MSWEVQKDDMQPGTHGLALTEEWLPINMLSGQQV